MDTVTGKVYVVEDNDSFRKSIVRLLHTFGYETVAFDSAAAFLSLNTFDYPGCLLLDVRLPDTDGLELQKLLQERGCRLPIVFMSGHGDIPVSIEVMKRGAVDFLPKPFDPEDLHEAIIQALIRSFYEEEGKDGKQEYRHK